MARKLRESEVLTPLSDWTTMVVKTLTALELDGAAAGPVGAARFSLVGWAVGSNVGRREGLAVGTRSFCVVGRRVGLSVRLLVGAVVVREDGAAVGVREVGATEMTAVGVGVGLAEGRRRSAEGALVGAGDGGALWTAVGLEVGILVAPSVTIIA